MAWVYLDLDIWQTASMFEFFCKYYYFSLPNMINLSYKETYSNQFGFIKNFSVVINSNFTIKR